MPCSHRKFRRKGLPKKLSRRSPDRKRCGRGDDTPAATQPITSNSPRGETYSFFGPRMVKIFERSLPCSELVSRRITEHGVCAQPLRREWGLTTLQRGRLPVGSGISLREAQEKSPAF